MRKFESGKSRKNAKTHLCALTFIDLWALSVIAKIHYAIITPKSVSKRPNLTVSAVTSTWMTEWLRPYTSHATCSCHLLMPSGIFATLFSVRLTLESRWLCTKLLYASNFMCILYDCTDACYPADISAFILPSFHLWTFFELYCELKAVSHKLGLIYWTVFDCFLCDVDSLPGK